MDGAYEYLTNYADTGERNMKFNINCGDNKRGIYLREKHHLLKPYEVVVTVEPVYMDNDSTGLFLQNFQKVAYFRNALVGNKCRNLRAGLKLLIFK